VVINKDRIVWLWNSQSNLLWAQVTLIPEESKIIVFRRGTPQGLNTIIPWGGQLDPISTLGAKLEWKNAQKKDTKKNTSEVIKRIIPIRRPSSTILVWNPWKVLSREISRHQVKAVSVSIDKLINMGMVLFLCIHFEIPLVKPKAKFDLNRGHGDSSTRWKGCINLVDILST